MNKVLPLLIILFTVMVIHAEESPKSGVILEQSGLDEIIMYALENNLQIKSLKNRWDASLHNASKVTKLPDPQLRFGHYLNEVETRVGPQKQKFGISQTFPWFRKLSLKGQSAKFKAKFNESLHRAIKLKIAYLVSSDYYELFYLLKSGDILSEHYQLLGNIEKIMKIKYTGDNAGFSDLIKLEIEKDKLEDRLRTEKEKILPVTSRMNALLNRDSYDPLPVPHTILIDSDRVRELLNREMILKNNPELQALIFLAGQKDKEIGLAKSAYFPDFTLSLDYIKTDDAVTPVEESGKDPLIASVKFNLPVNFRRNLAGVRQSKASYREALYAMENRKKELLSSIDQLEFKLENSRRKTELYENDLIPKARYAIEVAMTSYESGNTDAISLIDAQRTLLDLRISYYGYVVQYARSIAELRALAGDLKD